MSCHAAVAALIAIADQLLSKSNCRRWVLVTTIMKLSDEYDDFEVKLDRVHTRYDQTLALPLFDKDGDPV
jgi:hypothetical protein